MTFFAYTDGDVEERTMKYFLKMQPTTYPYFSVISLQLQVSETFRAKEVKFNFQVSMVVQGAL